MADIRASEITDGMRIHEYGGLDDDGFIVAKVNWHGDTVLVTNTEGGEWTFDRDEVVEMLTSRLIIMDGEPVSSCCKADVERRADYTDTLVWIVRDTETDEAGKIVVAKYKFYTTENGISGDNLIIACRDCGREIAQEDIEWQEG